MNVKKEVLMRADELRVGFQAVLADTSSAGLETLRDAVKGFTTAYVPSYDRGPEPVAFTDEASGRSFDAWVNEKAERMLWALDTTLEELDKPEPDSSWDRLALGEGYETSRALVGVLQRLRVEAPGRLSAGSGWSDSAILPFA